MPQETLDPDAVNLAKAIRQTESGGNFAAKGKSGEYGAYQYTNDTWKKNSADAGVNVELDKATPEQQNEVAYKTIKGLKDKGYNPGQIASIWNSGKPDAYLDTSYKGTNSHGAQYDVPAYAKSVATAYQKIKQGGQVQADPQNPSSTANTSPIVPQGQSNEQEEGLGGQLLGRINDVSKTLSSDQNVLSKGLQTAGALAGGVGDVVTSGLELIPGVKQLEGLIGKGAGALASTEAGKGIAKGYEALPEEWRKNIGAVGNIAGLLPIGKGIGLAKGAVSKALGKSALSAAIADVTPELAAKAGAKTAANQGLVKGFLSGKISPVTTSASKNVGQAVVDFVPNYSKLSTFTDKLNATRASVYKLADELKQAVIQSGSDRIFPFQELNARLRNIGKPIAIKSDKTLSRQFDLAREAALKIAQEKGGTISSLFDARKGFDDLVEKEFPNLYDRTNAPMRNAITSIRKEMNDFIAEQLPDVNFKESLLNQSRLFSAIDNLAPKAFGEVGTNALTRFGAKHPLIKGGAKIVGGGLLGGLGFEKAREFVQ